MNKLFFLLLFSIYMASCAESEKIQPNVQSQKNEEMTYSKAGDKKPEAFKSAFNVVDQMPLFGGCEDWDCSNQELIKYIQNNLKYPKNAKEARIEGRAYVQFIVEEDGKVSNLHLARDPGEGLGDAAIKIVEGMNELGSMWKPGIQDGKVVPVIMTLPFSYKLES